MYRFTHCGIECSVHLDYVGINVSGLPFLPPDLASYLGVGRDLGAVKTHLSHASAPGCLVRWNRREECPNNAEIEIELQGQFFSTQKDLDFVFGSIFSDGGSVRIFRCDLAFDYFGPVEEFTLESFGCRHPKGKDFHYGIRKQWTGFLYGSRQRRQWSFYDKIEESKEHGHYLPEQLEDWWRYEFRLGSEYCQTNFTPEYVTELTEKDLLWGMVGIAGDGSRYRAGFFTDVLGEMKEGKLKIREQRVVTFEKALDVAVDDVLRKIQRFQERFAHLRKVPFSLLLDTFISEMLVKSGSQGLLEPPANPPESKKGACV